jgi:uncharacterized protein (DUF486 family)
MIQATLIIGTRKVEMKFSSYGHLERYARTLAIVSVKKIHYSTK